MIEPPVCSLLRFPVATQIVASKIISKFNMTVSCASLKGFTIPVICGLEYILQLAYVCESGVEEGYVLVLTSLTFRLKIWRKG